MMSRVGIRSHTIACLPYRTMSAEDNKRKGKVMCFDEAVACATCKADKGTTITQDDFQAPYNPSPQVIAMAEDVFTFIEQNPHMWNQDNYGSEYSETNCFMGLLIRMFGDRFHSFSGYSAMRLLNMETEHADRLDFVAMYITDAGTWAHPTIEQMRERVSIALNHDFRKHNPDNDTPNAEMDFNDRVHDQLS